MAKLQILYDDFLGSSLNATPWVAAGTKSVSGGYLYLQSAGASVTSRSSYDITGSNTLVKFSSISGTGSMSVTDSSSNNITVTYNGVSTWNISGWMTGSFSASSATWIRISESGGNLRVEYSSNGTTWTTAATQADGAFVLTSVKLAITNITGAQTQVDQVGPLPPLFETITDGFIDPVLNTSVWSYGANVTTSAGKLTINTPTGSQSPNAISTLVPYLLVGSSFFFKYVSGVFTFNFQNDPSSSQLTYDGTTLALSQNFANTISTTTWNPATSPYVRISSNTIQSILDVSTNGTSWSNVGISGTPITGAITLQVMEQTINASTVYDSFNLTQNTVTGTVSTMQGDSILTASGAPYSSMKSSSASIVQGSPPDSNAWTNLSNINAEDGAYALGGMPAGGDLTPTLTITNLGFNIPSTAQVTGVKVETKESGYAYTDVGTALVVGGSATGRTNAGYSDPSGGSSFNWLSRGGQYDSWGLNLTAAQVNATNFGFFIQYQNTHGGSQVELDAFRVTVYYDVAPFYQVAQQHQESSYSEYGNQAFGAAEAVQQLINNTGTALPLGLIRYRWKAVYAIVGQDPKSGTGGTTYDRTGSPWTVKVYTNQTDATAQNSNYIKSFSGTLASTSWYTQDFDLTSANYTLPAGGSLWVVVVCTGVSGSGEPGFVDIMSSGYTAGTDPNQQIYITGAYNGGGSLTTTSEDWDYILKAQSLPAQASLSGDSTLTATGNQTVAGVAIIDGGDSSLVATPTPTYMGAASMSGDSTLSATGFSGIFAQIGIGADSNLTATGSYLLLGSASMSGDSTVPDVVAQRTAVASAAIGGSSTLTVDSSGISITHLAITKTYMYKVYDKNWNYLGIWDDVISEFGYSQEINSAGSQITVTLARNADTLVQAYDFLSDDTGAALLTDDGNTLAAETKTVNAIGSGTTVDLDLNVKIYEFSSSPTQSIDGDLVFTGYVSMYTSRYGQNENTDVSLFSYGADLDNWVLKDANNNTRVSYLSTDPSLMLKDSLDKFQAAGGLIYYDNTTIENTYAYTGGPTTYTFNLNTELEVITQCLTMAPTYWYFYADLATNLLHFHPQPSTISHYFTLGKHINSLDLEKTIEGLVNEVYFTGGTPTDVILDRFNDTTGKDLALHSGEISATWVKHPASATGTGMVITDANRVRPNATGEQTYYVNTNPGSNDVIIDVDYYVPSGGATNGDFGVVARMSPTTLTGYMARIWTDSTVQVFKVINGTYTQLNNSTNSTLNLQTALAPGQTRHMQFSVNGTRLTLMVDNYTYVDFDDTSVMQGTYAGIRSGGASTNTQGFHMDNFTVSLVDNSNQIPIFRHYTDTNSQTLYRRGLARMQDSRVTLPASADIIAGTNINQNNAPRYRSNITIAAETYDIRSIKLGQMVAFRNFGNFIDDIPGMQVVRLDYAPDAVTIQLDTLLPSVPKRLEDIKRNLNQQEVTDNPDAPTLGTIA